MTDWAKFGKALGGNSLPQVADGGYTPVEPGLTIGKLNQRNAKAFSKDMLASVPVAAGGSPELRPNSVPEYNYPDDYPVDPSEGLSPAGARSLAEINRRNAAEYGHSDSYNSPTNMVGDAKWKVELVLASGEKKSMTVEAGSGDEAQYKAMKFFPTTNHIVSSEKVG